MKQFFDFRKLDNKDRNFLNPKILFLADDRAARKKAMHEEMDIHFMSI